MNNTRRKSLEVIKDALEELSNRIDMAKVETEGQNSAIEELKDEEQEYMDNMPESLQSGERYENADAAVSAMDEAYNSIDSAMNSLQEAYDYLQEAMESLATAAQ